MPHPSSFRTQRHWLDCRMTREFYPYLPIGRLHFSQHKGTAALAPGAITEPSQNHRPTCQPVRFLRVKLISVGTTTPTMKPDLRLNGARALAVRTSLRFSESMRTSIISRTLASQLKQPIDTACWRSTQPGIRSTRTLPRRLPRLCRHQPQVT